MKNIFRWRNFIQSDGIVTLLMTLSGEVRSLKKEVSDLPHVVQIMTKTGCNYKCNFCPNKDIIHEPKEMSLELYNKILNELGLQWNGLLSLFIHNEPFLDKRIIDLTRLAREKLPKCKIEIQTNGSVLEKEDIENILPYLDILKVNDYTGDFRVIDRIEKYNIKNQKLVLVKRYPLNESLSNRAGHVEYKKMKKKKLPLKKFCVMPFQVFSIIPDGKVILCCNDWKHEYIFGDVSQDPIKKIWKNEKFKSVREILKRSDRSHNLCRNCDYVGFSIGDIRRKYYKLYKFLEGYI